MKKKKILFWVIGIYLLIGLFFSLMAALNSFVGITKLGFIKMVFGWLYYLIVTYF